MGQQLHTYLRWTTIKLEQFDYVRANADNPELSIAGASVGIDIVFFYIRQFHLALGPRKPSAKLPLQNSIVTTLNLFLLLHGTSLDYQRLPTHSPNISDIFLGVLSWPTQFTV